MKTIIPAMALLAALAAQPAVAEPAKTVAPVATPPAADAPWPEAYFEIFKLAPGKQEAFIRDIARGDLVSAAGGEPPMQIYFHEDGADWDVLLFKPARTEKPTAAQEAAMAAKASELQIETGPAYYVRIREMIASHTDTKAYGPVSAAAWLARLDKWRAGHPSAVSHPAP
ncbi:MAG: hypothetical protein JWN66_812 [Sphingomonas bacterium]|uniref:hypothetical protein n=1 Tax=Sphingomonas bacterium TaxID=1895847 RepID=UPI00261F03A2|nr:hypothetical protein [Sphingomonas bacterium]MDB5703696.1 hypothetical protein [Sphingomonas bacterium]